MIVADASVINKLFLPNEEGHYKAKQILANHIEKKEEVIVPDLLFYEVANTLTTKTTIPLPYVFESLAKLYTFNFHTYKASAIYLSRAAKIAKDYHISIYDAVYAVLAKEKDCKLITADEKFVNQINLPYITLL